MKIMGIGSFLIEGLTWILNISATKLKEGQFTCIRNQYLIPLTTEASIYMTFDDLLSLSFIFITWFSYYLVPLKKGLITTSNSSKSVYF